MSKVDRLELVVVGRRGRGGRGRRVCACGGRRTGVHHRAHAIHHHHGHGLAAW